MTLKESIMRKNIRQKADIFSSVTPTGTTPLILIDSIFEKENLISRSINLCIVDQDYFQ